MRDITEGMRLLRITAQRMDDSDKLLDYLVSEVRRGLNQGLSRESIWENLTQELAGQTGCITRHQRHVVQMLVVAALRQAETLRRFSEDGR